MSSLNFPTAIIDLPSKGLLYPKDSLLASGSVEMKYMTAKEEDILTNPNYIDQGIVIDKLLQSLVVSKINYDELLIGDKNAILIGARIMGYGPEYTFKYNNQEISIDLSTLKEVEIDEEFFKERINEFNFTLPISGVDITFKLLTHADEKLIEEEVEGYKKIDKNASPEGSTRLKHIITSVNGDNSKKTVREFVDNALLARDARSLREYIRSISPDVDTKIYVDGGPEEGINIPFGLSFLWPDLGV